MAYNECLASFGPAVGHVGAGQSYGPASEGEPSAERGRGERRAPTTRRRGAGPARWRRMGPTGGCAWSSRRGKGEGRTPQKRPEREIVCPHIALFINFPPWQTRPGSLDRPLRGPPAMAAPFLSFELPFDSRAKMLEGKTVDRPANLKVEPFETFGRILSETAGACHGVSSRRLNRLAKQKRFAALACRRPAQTGKARNCRTDEAPIATRVLRIWFDAPST